MPEPTAVHLVGASVPLLEALSTDRARFGAMIGSPVPGGWPEFPEAVPAALAYLRRAPIADHRWSMHFFVESASGRLVGSGGFAGPPRDRTVETGYEVAPAFRGRGLGAAALRALLLEAGRSGQVDCVVANTLPGPNASTSVLVRNGFSQVGVQTDPEVGPTWRWRWVDPALGSTVGDPRRP